MAVSEHPVGTDDREAAQRLLAKVRAFVSGQLDEREAALFAALVAPGVLVAYAGEEVSGFAAEVEWRPDAVPEALVEVLREGGVTVLGLAER
jgi:hypothetical protein